ncbi:MAG: methyltransferase [Paracoccaceae bacterium]|nr:methyltransferase [Paracoccaceae bacterium]
MASTDAFLGGRLQIAQAEGYRAGADPVFLAAAVQARPGEAVLELGCGVGTALLCLGRRVEGLSLTGLERDPAQAALAEANAARNAIPLDVWRGDLTRMPETLAARTFDHVMMNPPFFRDGSPSGDRTRAGARHEDTPLAAWIDAGLRRLRSGGRLTVIHRTERVPDLLAAIGGRAGDTTLRPLAPRVGRPAKLVVLSATKGARGPFRLLPPFVLHTGDSHGQDGDDYTPAASAILREGFGFPD